MILSGEIFRLVFIIFKFPAPPPPPPFPLSNILRTLLPIGLQLHKQINLNLLRIILNDSVYTFSLRI